MSDRKHLIQQVEAMNRRLIEQADQQSTQETKHLLENEKRLIRVNITDIDPYDRNPRTEVNPEFGPIKESIRSKGLETILTITKRPGDAKYTLAKGGKTRLTILKELSKEDGGEKWLYQECLFEPFQSETALLSSHLIENMQRGAMSFWDTAQGIMAMRETMEQERSRPIGRDELQGEFAQIGVSLDVSFPNEAEFAVKHFSPLGVLAHGITRNDVRRSLRPQFNNIKEIWLKHPSFTEEMFELHYGEFIALYQAGNDALDLPTLMNLIVSEYALILDLQVQQLESLCQLVTKKEHRNSPLETLIAFITKPSSTEKAPLEPLAQSGVDVKNDTKPSTAQSPSVLTPGQQRLHDKLSSNTPFESESQPSNVEDFIEDDYAQSMGVGHAGIEGLSVSDGSNLTPVAPPAPKLPPHKQLIQKINSVLVQFNLRHLLMPLSEDSPAYPLGMILDFPAQPIEDPNAAHAWWLIASFTGQLDRASRHEQLPDCLFKQIYTDPEDDGIRMFELMGQVLRDDSSFIVAIATNPKHPFSDVLFEMLTLLRQHNLKKGGD